MIDPDDSRHLNLPFGNPSNTFQESGLGKAHAGPSSSKTDTAAMSQHAIARANSFSALAQACQFLTDNDIESKHELAVIRSIVKWAGSI